MSFSRDVVVLSWRYICKAVFAAEMEDKKKLDPTYDGFQFNLQFSM